MSESPKQRRKFCFCPSKPKETLPLARSTQQRSCFSSTSYSAPESLIPQYSARAKQPQHDESSSVTRRRESKGEESTSDRGGGSGSGSGSGRAREGRGGEFVTSSSSSAVEVMRPRDSTMSRYQYSSRTEVEKVASSTRLPHHDCCQLQQFLDEAASGDSLKINCKLNAIFEKRLRDIDSSAEGDPDLKLVTYQEWIDMLLKINEAIINNMQDLEEEVSEKLELVQRKAISRSDEDGSELDKCRKDIATLLKVIQNGYHHSNWNIKDLQFETITQEDVFGCKDHKASTREGSVRRNSVDAEAQKIKLMANVKALAIEVAERHDEVRDMKNQVLCLEDEIQNAQKKIQLKDDVIKELRSDLRFANSKLSEKSSTSTLTYVAMPPINFDTGNTARSTSTQVCEGLSSQHQLLQYSGTQDDCSQYNSLAHNEQLEQEKLKLLEEELNELFAMTKDLKKQNYEFHRKRLSDIFQKSESEKTDAYRKLDFIRRQLADLEAKQTDPYSRSWNECDSGFSSKSENDKDVKILDGVRKRIRKLNECTFELKKRVQQLEIENNELSSNLQTEKSFVTRNSETLKQVADLLSDMTGQQFSYNDIYNAQPQCNPFCDVIEKLEKMRLQRENQLGAKIQKMEETLYNNEQEITELEQQLMRPDKSSPNTVTTTTTKRATILKRAIHVQQQHQHHVQQSTHERQQRLELVDSRKCNADDTKKSNKKNNTNTNSTSATTTTTNKSNSHFQQFPWNW